MKTTTRQAIRELFRGVSPGERMSFVQVRDLLRDEMSLEVDDETVRTVLYKMSRGNVPELARIRDATDWGGNVYYLLEHPDR